MGLFIMIEKKEEQMDLDQEVVMRNRSIEIHALIKLGIGETDYKTGNCVSENVDLQESPDETVEDKFCMLFGLLRYKLKFIFFQK
ncbi:MAG: hypothetical protein EZS28_012067 [Streblomastix strix]|uniref:Uncharacterized protein n=1 Tax=Streblomastix strix TaxID=222440 RepID=A0A5J4WBT7_9EUKA|nr:MAG: hypothetical protein EZS28_012067 [Streblomastix strix]